MVPSIVRKLKPRLVHVFFLIRSLNVGGAERQLVELSKRLDPNRFTITIGLFYDEGELRKELYGAHNVKFLPLNKSGRWDFLRFVCHLRSCLRDLAPDIVYSFLPEANLVGLIAGRLARIPSIVWGVRASDMDIKQYHWLFGVSLRMCALLSSFPDLIVSNSFAGLKYHKNIGYNGRDMIVVHNGIDTAKFRPDRDLGKKVRLEWGIKDNEILIGIVARLDPMKGHLIFLQAVEVFLEKYFRVRFVCVGDGTESYKSKLHSFEDKLGLVGSVIWTGKRTDLPAVYNAIDIVTSSSVYGEGFSNVIGEAMACGVPCVVTDVGDASDIVGDNGVVVPPKNSKALAEGWLCMIELSQNGNHLRSKEARSRILTEFGSEKLVRKTSKMLLSLL